MQNTFRLSIYLLIYSLLQFVCVSVTAQNQATESYISTYKKLAVKEMKRVGVPASITLAQGILESGNGNSELAKTANNHFGIKCVDNWTGGKVYRDDDAKNECFRKYRKVKHSYTDHSDFMRDRKRYAFLFELERTDYKAWAEGLKKAGYATNPNYPQLLINLIEKYELNAYDARGRVKVPKGKTKDTPKQEQIKLHTVKKKDTLYSISKKYDTTVTNLQQLNNKTGTDIKIGEQLRVR